MARSSTSRPIDLLAAGAVLAVAALVGCHHGASAGKPPLEQRVGPAYDRPFAFGQVSDAHWDSQQTNAEAADFVFYDHEFVGETAELTKLGQKHLMQTALRLPHVPFPVVVEESPEGHKPQLDQQRRATLLAGYQQIGAAVPESRVVVAPVFAEGLSAVEGEAAYYGTLNNNLFPGFGRSYGGYGGVWR